MIKAIIFDFDGVIVDSYYATTNYFQKTLAHFHKRVPKDEEFKDLLGLKTKDILKNFIPDSDEEEFNKIFIYSKQQSVKAVPLITIIKDAREVIRELSRKYKLAIASSRGKQTINILLDKYKLRSFFEIVITREDTIKHKPNPESINKCLKFLKIEPNQAVYVGDMREDVQSAKNAKVISIFINAKQKNNFNADYTVSSIKQTGKLLDRI